MQIETFYYFKTHPQNQSTTKTVSEKKICFISQRCFGMTKEMFPRYELNFNKTKK